MSRFAGLAIGVFAVLGGVRGTSAQTFVVTDLGTLGGTAARARDVNANGLVVGRATIDGNKSTHGFLFVPNKELAPLDPIAGGTGSGAQGINSTGQWVGHSSLGDHVRHAIMSGKSILDLGTLGGIDSGASAINDDGWATGNADRPDGVEHAFIHRTFTGTANLEIPDSDPLGVSHVIHVPHSFTIADLNVGLVIEHTWVGDLCISLTAPGGSPSVSLVQRMGALLSDPCHQDGPPFGCGSDDLSVVLDDEGMGGPIEDLCGPDLSSDTPPSSPNYSPSQALSAFSGLDAAGDWTLTVVDNSGQDFGTLEIWSLHFMEDLGSLKPGGSSAGLGINNQGVVSGVSAAPGAEDHPVIFLPGPVIVDLGTFGGRRGASHDINDEGMAVGYADDELGNARAFKWTNSKAGKIPLGDLGGDESVATGVNAAGNICGYSTVKSTGTVGSAPRHAFAIINGQMIDIHPEGFVASEAYGMNNLDAIVGMGLDDNGNPHALKWAPASCPQTASLDAAALSVATYPCGSSLSRIGNNVLRLIFDVDLNWAPAPGEIEVRKLMSDGAFGPDISGLFEFVIEGTNVLRINEIGQAFENETWYAVMNTGGWCSTANFEIDYACVLGDANNNHVNDFGDLSAISAMASFPDDTPDDSRFDINTEAGVSFADQSAANAYYNSQALPSSKPSGHGCFPTP